jgi:hypothetical protein
MGLCLRLMKVKEYRAKSIKEKRREREILLN